MNESIPPFHYYNADERALSSTLVGSYCENREALSTSEKLKNLIPSSCGTLRPELPAAVLKSRVSAPSSNFREGSPLIDRRSFPKELHPYIEKMATQSPLSDLLALATELMHIFYQGIISISPLLFTTSFISSKRYTNEDLIWCRPKSLICGNLLGAGPDQKANQYPDMYAAYFVSDIRLPKGATLTLKGKFPHARYFSFTVANQLGDDGEMGNGNFIRDNMIKPDEGSSNPYISTNSRDAKERSFTIQVVQGKAPETPPPNTLYTGSDGEDERIHLSMRVYLADDGYDLTGNVPLAGDGNGLPEVTLNLPGGETIQGPELIQLLDAQKNGDGVAYDREAWVNAAASSKDPDNAPCYLPIPVAQLFRNKDYSVSGLFIEDPEKRVETYPADNSGAFLSNPDTPYMTMPYSLNYGDVVLIRGKHPSHPSTRRGEKEWSEKEPDLRYFSVSTAGAPPSGEGWYTLYDEQIEVDDEGYFTIAVSTPRNRPANATEENKVSWITHGNGEGFFKGARPLLGEVYFRYQCPSDSWKESPANIPPPTPEHPIPQDPLYMKEYYPRAVYLSKEEFEGCHGNFSKFFANHPANPLDVMAQRQRREG